MAYIRKESLEIARDILTEALDVTALPQDDILILRHTLLTLMTDQDTFKVCHSAIYGANQMVRCIRRANETS